MRENKFRGRAVEKGNLVYGWGCFTDEGSKKYIILSENNWIQVEQIQSSANLYDKNGKEIYEGDVVRYDLSPASKSKPLIGTVEYDRAGYGFQQKDGFIHFSVFNRLGGLEVIGNIYENPELLKANDSRV